MKEGRESQPQESPIKRIAYTLRQWDEEVSPFIGPEKRLQPMKERDDEQFHYLRDIETGAVYCYDFVKQQGGTTGEHQKIKPVPEPEETTWINCIKEN